MHDLHGLQIISHRKQVCELLWWALSPVASAEWGDVSLLDATLPDLDMRGPALAAAGSQVLVYGGRLHSARVLYLLDHGVLGYVPETAHLPELRDAVTIVASGASHLPFARPQEEAPVGLTVAERRAADAYFIDGAGLLRSEVAAQIGLSESTLRNQLASVRRRLGAAPQMSREALGRRYLAMRGAL
jgi:two-component system response regulator DesR